MPGRYELEHSFKNVIVFGIRPKEINEHVSSVHAAVGSTVSKCSEGSTNYLNYTIRFDVSSKGRELAWALHSTTLFYVSFT